MRLKDKAVLITGAAHGIGRATLELFAKEGARLVACDIEEGPLREAAEAVGAHPVVMDVADPASVERGFAEALAHLGRLDGVVHYAGITRDNFHWKTTSPPRATRTTAPGRRPSSTRRRK